MENANLGFAGAAHTGFQLTDDDVLGPDAACISYARQPELPERYFMGAPDLAVEVVSPTDSLRKAQRKARKYLEHRTKVVWIVYPDEETVDVCRLSESGRLMIDEVGKDGVLDGGRRCLDSRFRSVSFSAIKTHHNTNLRRLFRADTSNWRIIAE